MPKRDFYEVLGVSKDADEKAIKSAYRKLAMANHPDRNAGDEAASERFKEASEAYEVLKDSQKRAAYDQMGHAAFDQTGGFGGGGGNVGDRIHPAGVDSTPDGNIQENVYEPVIDSTPDGGLNQRIHEPGVDSTPDGNLNENVHE